MVVITPSIGDRISRISTGEVVSLHRHKLLSLPYPTIQFDYLDLIEFSQQINGEAIDSHTRAVPAFANHPRVRGMEAVASRDGKAILAVCSNRCRKYVTVTISKNISRTKSLDTKPSLAPTAGCAYRASPHGHRCTCLAKLSFDGKPLQEMI